MYKLIIWVDGHVLSLSSGVPSRPCVWRRGEKKSSLCWDKIFFFRGERFNVSFCLTGSENSSFFFFFVIVRKETLNLQPKLSCEFIVIVL